MEHRRNRGRMTWGIFLVSAGTLLMAERFGALPLWLGDYQWWALIVALFGFSMLIFPERAERVGTGVTLILLSGWFFIVTNDLYGLTWSNSWPLALVAAGAGTFAHAIAAHWLPDRERVRVVGPYVRVTDDSKRETEVRDA